MEMVDGRFKNRMEIEDLKNRKDRWKNFVITDFMKKKTKQMLVSYNDT